ncbi:hypothetical protein M406DRAFT_358399 [Cryphonectria parasitica EP155]|uniref:N-acetyltransferase domain-containing protein n=1 Tax=Cryphonectria parasitica (strain ATCC 38755 / EP155) TaxID=660469 RepID=A0A9P5CKM3_CRYP1|nr:uncharacterized protein M406DRAFT_358399 [Cryphonectria parasitica EP155]KAF3760925.1 hypothetical protein M406DRAFT_358399 [Cryphonectria parasitica EP155]
MASTTENTTASQKPRITVRRATPADAQDLASIHFDAFGPDVMDRLMYPGGVTDSARSQFCKDLFTLPYDINSNKDEKPASATGAAATTTTTSSPAAENIVMLAELHHPEDGEGAANPNPEIVAFAKWELIKEPLPEEKWNVVKEYTSEMLGEGVNVGVYTAFIGDLQRLRRKHLKGDPLLHLDILACRTGRQRLGAGTALLNWGNELADREGKMHWLDASPKGYALYKRLGFEDVDVQDLNITELWGVTRAEGEDWGAGSAVVLAGPLADGCHRATMMKRFPKKR